MIRYSAILQLPVAFSLQFDACITTYDGNLMSGYRYLDAVLKRAPSFINSAKHDLSMTLSLEGHLFDSGLINHILNVVEQHQGSLQFERCLIPPLVDARTSKSTAVLKIMASDDSALHVVYGKIQALVDVIPKAEAALRRVDLPPSAPPGQVIVQGEREEHRVLVLGAGHVAEALVDYLGRSSHLRITVASKDEDSARRVSSLCRNGQHVAVDVCNDLRRLSSLVGDSKLVVSLLPAPLHPIVAEECIHHRSHLVTASYESPEIRLLEPRVKEAGVIFLNEVGLDPGLDHMSAKKIVDDILHRGGKVTLFSSVCGGLPSPEVAHYNPFQYKFSWNPQGVIRACQNDARYRWEGQIHEVHGSELLRSATPFVEDWPDLSLECIPNRDSLKYESVYGIGGAQTIFRGTLRYRGFSALMNVLQGMGLFGSERASGDTWEELLYHLRMRRGGFSSLQDYVEACTDDDPFESQRALKAIEWLDPRSPIRPGAEVVDEFCRLLESKLHYDHGERDLVLMSHRVEAEFETETHEKHVASLVVVGDTKASAMAKTVGYTTAASAELILDGLLQNQRGLLLPTSEHIYLPVLAMVAREGILFDERVLVHTSPVERSA
jgi:alpha-aminoadipic semialdehyde synthase